MQPSPPTARHNVYCALTTLAPVLLCILPFPKTLQQGHMHLHSKHVFYFHASTVHPCRQPTSCLPPLGKGMPSQFLAVASSTMVTDDLKSSTPSWKCFRSAPTMDANTRCTITQSYQCTTSTLCQASDSEFLSLTSTKADMAALVGSLLDASTSRATMVAGVLLVPAGHFNSFFSCGGVMLQPAPAPMFIMSTTYFDLMWHLPVYLFCHRHLTFAHQHVHCADEPVDVEEHPSPLWLLAVLRTRTPRFSAHPPALS